MHILEIKKVESVLGVLWLEHLGKVVADYREITSELFFIFFK